MSALDGLVAMCELLPREGRVGQLLPLVRQHMQPLELELPLQRTLAAAFPRLLAAVSKHAAQSCAGPLAVECLAPCLIVSGAVAGCGSLVSAVGSALEAVVSSAGLQHGAADTAPKVWASGLRPQAAVGLQGVCDPSNYGCRCMMIWSQQMPA